ncbi:MAG: hypothetical protein N3I86_05605 [Verrucomicrobiae bacterium]|nr:hypothetical protein [Verrucomicrobiae bacterium]MDW8308712.1 hypothetical protein [Verrucomicrobiales bacterium]
MNRLEQLRQKLIAAARLDVPADTVPWAFEQRVLARLRAPRSLDLAAFWARALWRAAAPCVALSLALLTWHLAVESASAPEPEPQTLAQQLEQTLLAAVQEQTADESTDVW